MLIDLVEFPWYSLPLFAVFFVLNWWIFLRKSMPSFFDPLNFGMNLTTAGTLTVYTSMKLVGALKGWYGIQVPFFTLLVLLSVRIGALFPMRRILVAVARVLGRKKSRDEDLIWISGIVFYCGAAAVFIAKFGMPILYDNPLHSKMMYSGGDGSIRRILQSAVLFVCISSIGIFLRRNKRVGLIVFFLSTLLVSLLVVSKSALVGSFTFLIFLLNAHGDYRLNKYAIPFFIVGIAFSFLTIYLGLRSVLPDAGMDFVLRAFVTRVIAFGDACFYLLDGNHLEIAFRDDDIFSLIRTNLAAFLAGVRLISWDDAPSTGGRIYAQIIGTYTGVGPNSTLQTEGWLYLGWFGGLYCFLSGFLVMWIRRIALIGLRFGDDFIAFLGGTIFFGVSSVFVDGSYWGTMGISFLFSLGTLAGIYLVYLLLLILGCGKFRARKLFYLGRCS